jgi:hypothetical protein
MLCFEDDNLDKLAIMIYKNQLNNAQNDCNLVDRQKLAQENLLKENKNMLKLDILKNESKA